MSSKLLEMEGVTITRFSAGPLLGTRYELDNGTSDLPIRLTLDQMEALARELPFIVEQERGGDSTGGEN